MTRPARPAEALPKLGLLNSTPSPPLALASKLPMVVELLEKPKGARLSLLKMLKKLARNSRFAPSPRWSLPGKRVCFTRLMSMLKYLGPRKLLRPIPGGAATNPPEPFGIARTMKKGAPPPGKLLPVMKALLDVSMLVGPV